MGQGSEGHSHSLGHKHRTAAHSLKQRLQPMAPLVHHGRENPITSAGAFRQILCAEAVLSLPGMSWCIFPTITNLDAFSQLLVFRDWFQETKMPSLKSQTVLCRWSLEWKLKISLLKWIADTWWNADIDPGSEQIIECTSTIWMAKYFQ